MGRICHLLLATALLLPVSLYGQGVIPLTPEEYASLPQVVLPDSAVASQQRPKLLVLPSPPPGHQGSLGSCTAWATAYAAMGVLYYDQWKHDWQNLARSPLFVYNNTRITDSCGGIAISRALTFLRDVGACSMRDLPYSDQGCNSPTPEYCFSEAHSFRVSWGAIASNALVNSDVYKNLLWQGLPVVFVVKTTETFKNQWDSPWGWRSDVDEPDNPYSHAMCMVGYDDDRRMFKVQNSYGPNRGDGGFFWMAYSLVEQGRITEAYAVGLPSEQTDFAIHGPSVFCSPTEYSVNGWADWKVEGPARLVKYSNGKVMIEPTGRGRVILRNANAAFSYRYLWAGSPDLTLTRNPSIDDTKWYTQYVWLSLLHAARLQHIVQFDWQVEEARDATLFSYGDAAMLSGNKAGWELFGYLKASNACGSTRELFSVSLPLPDPPDTYPPGDPCYREPRQLTDLSADGEIGIQSRPDCPDDPWSVQALSTRAELPLWIVTTVDGYELMRTRGEEVSIKSLPKGRIYVITAVIGLQGTSKTVVW